MSIYVLRSDNLVKIGFTENLRKRVGAILSSVPVPVEFVGHMPGGRDVEAHFHERFASWRFSGEWFVETPEMRAVFDAVLTPCLPDLKRSERNPKRTAEEEAVRAMADAVRKESALRWPHMSKGQRIEAIAEQLGWNKSRVKDFYYRDPRVALRAFEKDELALWLRLPARTGTEG